MNNEQTFTPGVRALFLASLSSHGVIGRACDEAGVSRRTVDRYRQDDTAFAEAFADALESGIDVLEAAAVLRAVHGVEELVYYKGEVVGSVTRYSDSLLSFLLERKRYKQTVRTELSTPDGALEITDPAKKASILAGILNRAKTRKDASDLT